MRAELPGRSLVGRCASPFSGTTHVPDWPSWRALSEHGDWLASFILRLPASFFCLAGLLDLQNNLCLALSLLPYYTASDSSATMTAL